MRSTETARSETIPPEIGGHPVDRALSPESYLAIGPGGRGVVLKKLHGDCLPSGLLHPSIRERLCRVRELAHCGIANLHGVAREGGDAYLIWEYVEGEPFTRHLSRINSPRQLLLFARELVLALDALHLLGIVHGAVHGGNIIIADSGAVRLTHVSPLLHSDAAEDAEAVMEMLLAALDERGEARSAFGRLLRSALNTGMPLRDLAVRCAELLIATEGHRQPARKSDSAPRFHRRSLFGAAVVVVFACAFTYGVRRSVVDPQFPSKVTRWVATQSAQLRLR